MKSLLVFIFVIFLPEWFSDYFCHELEFSLRPFENIEPLIQIFDSKSVRSRRSSYITNLMTLVNQDKRLEEKTRYTTQFFNYSCICPVFAILILSLSNMFGSVIPNWMHI